MKTIKAILATAACVALVATASAQNFTAAKVGIVEENGVTTLSYPQTTLTINMVVEKSTTVAGPYARYAQKYLGSRAPLTDKVSYAIVETAISATDTAPRQPHLHSTRVARSFRCAEPTRSSPK